MTEKWIQTSDILPDIFPLDNHTGIRYYIVMEQIVDTFTFFNADQLSEQFKTWEDSLGKSSGRNPILLLEDRHEDLLQEATLIEYTLSDGSKVYNVRLS